MLTSDDRYPSGARVWNQVLLHSIRNYFARPTVHAHSLFHVFVDIIRRLGGLFGQGKSLSRGQHRPRHELFERVSRCPRIPTRLADDFQATADALMATLA